MILDGHLGNSGAIEKQRIKDMARAERQEPQSTRWARWGRIRTSP